MKEPTTPEELKALHNLLRSDPQHYVQIVQQTAALLRKPPRRRPTHRAARGPPSPLCGAG